MQFDDIFVVLNHPNKIISILLDYCQILIFFHGDNFIFYFWSVLQEVKWQIVQLQQWEKQYNWVWVDFLNSN